MYRNYETLKKIIIDRKANLWTSIMKLTFEFLNIKHRKTTSYHFRTNDAVKRFNDVLNYMFTKYCIDESIKNWNLYLNQVLFVIKIRTHIIIDFFFLLYEINSHFFDDQTEFISDLYDERIDFASFLSRDKATAFKITMTRVMKNKIVWNSKIKKFAFKSENLILIKIKKFKKFEMNWYDSYEMIRNKILNIYVFKFFENSFNKYFINDDRMKLINVDEKVIKNWRMSRDKEKSAKAKITIDDNKISDAVIITIKKRDRFKKIISINENDEYLSSLNELEEDADHIIWKFQKEKKTRMCLYDAISLKKSFLCLLCLWVLFWIKSHVLSHVMFSFRKKKFHISLNLEIVEFMIWFSELCLRCLFFHNVV